MLPERRSDSKEAQYAETPLRMKALALLLPRQQPEAFSKWAPRFMSKGCQPLFTLGPKHEVADGRMSSGQSSVGFFSSETARITNNKSTLWRACLAVSAGHPLLGRLPESHGPKINGYTA